jgi:phosphatidylserine synthase
MALTLMRDQVTAGAGAAVVIVMSLLMLSKWGLPELKGRGVVSAMLLVGLANYVAVVVHPTWTAVGWWNLWNVAIVVAARARERRTESTQATT